MPQHSPHGAQPHSDALVIFGISGDLAFKKIFPALYALVRSGALSVPVIGVAATDWSREQLHQQARKSLQAETGMDDPAVCERLLALLFYVYGDYRAPETFAALKEALKNAQPPAQRPAYYLAIPPSLFNAVIQGLQSAGITAQARVIVEKPFGRDLASAQELSRIGQSAFAENAIFRIDHYLGKEALMNLLYFRFANSFFEPLWNRANIASVEITLAEGFGIEERGAFYETAGCLRDVVQNHMLQIVALLAMEPPAYQGVGAVQQAKANVFYAMRALVPGDATLFSNQAAVEAAWAVVDPVLTEHAQALPYPPGSWGPPEADALIAASGGWHNPKSAAAASAPIPPAQRAAQ